MHTMPQRARRALTTLALAAALPLAAHAAPVSYFTPYAGSGNVSVFDATSGGWVGAIDATPDATPAPYSLVSVVLFNLDPLTLALSGSFEFTTTDLASSLFGTLGGSAFDADILASGGQFSIDYQITGGSGSFAGASGFGLAFLSYDPLASFDNYSEIGLLSFDVPGAAVPEPQPLALVALALGLLAWTQRGARLRTAPSMGAR